jgi:hypothetical protein
MRRISGSCTQNTLSSALGVSSSAQNAQAPPNPHCKLTVQRRVTHTSCTCISSGAECEAGTATAEPAAPAAVLMLGQPSGQPAGHHAVSQAQAVALRQCWYLSSTTEAPAVAAAYSAAAKGPAYSRCCCMPCAKPPAGTSANATGTRTGTTLAPCPWPALVLALALALSLACQHTRLQWSTGSRMPSCFTEQWRCGGWCTTT